jgi:hypothetical protein
LGLRTEVRTLSFLDYTARLSGPNEVAQYVWNSYDAVVSTTTSGATIADSATGTIPAQVVVYSSSNNGGVDFGSLLPTYRTKTHPETFNHLAAGYWCGAYYPGYDYPYFGKSGVGRGADLQESNTPQPSGVRDFQMYPPDDNNFL